MVEMISRHISIIGTYNIRDLGGYKTQTGAKIPWKTFLRGDSPHLLNSDGVKYLYGQGVRLVVDLRTKSEIDQASNPFEKFPLVEYVNLPIFEDLAPIIMLQKQVSDENPLLRFYLEAIHRQGDSIKEVFKKISSIRNGAVMFNCTAGKDRTGIIAALLLGLAGVSDDEIINDYTATASLIPELVKSLLAESKARGVNVKRHAKMLESPGNVMKLMLLDVRSKFGSIENYLREIGLNQKELKRLEQLLGN